MIYTKYNKYNSFNEAKSSIISSALGKALSIASDATIATVADKIKGVANKGNLNWSGSNTTYSVSAGYYTGGTLDSRTSYNNGYSSGRTQGQNDVKNSPNSYGLYTKSQYDSNYNSGRSQGQNDVKNNPNGYGLYSKSQYDANWSSGYNSGRGNIKVASGSTATSFTENATWNGTTKSRVCLNIAPGGNPLLIFAYRTNHNDVAAMTASFGFVNTGGRNYVVTSRHQFNSSGIHLPTTDGSTGQTWNWYCAIY